MSSWTTTVRVEEATDTMHGLEAHGRLILDRDETEPGWVTLLIE